MLEWAKGEESVDDIRKRTASHFVSGSTSGAHGKKKRFDLDSGGGAGGDDEDDE